ncbi:putative ribonuclease H-like domain-containing protein [Tanacetum coccineum]
MKERSNLIGIKRFLSVVEVTAASYEVTTAGYVSTAGEEIILNGDSPLPTRTVDGVETAVPPTTTDQRLVRKNELKARGTLLMALPNEHQLKFNTYKTAKSLMEAIKKRFGGNKESKKLHRILLKQWYKNFNGNSSEGLDQIYDRLQKLISQLEIHGETISQEDLNLKLLRSLPSEWKTHTLIWRNKLDFKTLSMDDFTNEAVKTAYGDSTANSKDNAYTLPNVDSLSKAVIYSFFASQSNSSQLDNEDLKQIDPDPDGLVEDGLEVADGNDGQKEQEDFSDTGKDSMVFMGLIQLDFKQTRLECYNCHKRGHFARECRAPKYQDNRNRETMRRTVPVEETTSNALVLQVLQTQTLRFIVFEEDIKILKLDIMLSDNALIELRKKFEKANKERDDLKLTLEKFENSSKNLSKLLDSQDKYVFSESVTSVPAVTTSEVKTSKSKPKAVSEPLIEDWISDSENENETEFKSKQRKPSNAIVEFVKSNEHVKSPRESVKKKIVEKPIWNNARKVNHQNSQRLTHPHPKRNCVPREVLMKSDFKTLNTARQNSSRAVVSVNTVRPINTAYPRPTVNCARLVSNVFNRAHSHVRRPFNKFTTNKNNNFNDKVNTVRGNIITVGPKAVVDNNKGNEANVVKASACWVWRPKQKVLDHGNPQQELKDKGVIDSGCSRHISLWANKNLDDHPKSINNPDYKQLQVLLLGYKKLPTSSPLALNYKEIDGGFVAFGGSTKGGKITWKEFKLTDESHVLLKVPRKDNMYNIDLKNVVPQGGKFDGKANEGFFVGYPVNSKAFRVFNRTRILEETLHITFLENKPNVAGSGPEWLFDIDTLTKSMNYKPVVAGNQTNGNADPSLSKGPKNTEDNAGKKITKVLEKESRVSSKEDDKDDQDLSGEFEIYGCADDLNMPNLDEIVYSDNDEDVGAEADMTNLDIHIPVSSIPNTRIHKDHPVEQIIRDIHLAPQTKRMTKHVTAHAEPKKVIQTLKDPSWIEAMQEELLQFKLQQVWTLVDLPHGKIAIEGIDYDEVFALVARIEAIRLFLAYASFKDFVMYQMDVKSAFLYEKIKEEVYVYQPPGFEDPEFPDNIYNVEKALYGLHQAHRAWYETLSTYFLDNGFQKGHIDKTLFIKRVKDDILQIQVYVDDINFRSTRKEMLTQKDDGIFISQDKYVDEILKKFGFSTVKTASTPMETSKPLMKDENAKDVDVHLYKSMIGSLMYLISSRHDIMFTVCACARFQVTPKVSHLHAVKRIFKYLKGQPKLGLWYP